MVTFSFPVVRTLEVYSLKKFQVSNVELLTMVTTACIRPPGILRLVTEGSSSDQHRPTLPPTFPLPLLPRNPWQPPLYSVSPTVSDSTYK